MPRIAPGARFGRLRVAYRLGFDLRGFSLWRCICDCGHEPQVSERELAAGRVSCGCVTNSGAVTLIPVRTSGSKAILPNCSVPAEIIAEQHGQTRTAENVVGKDGNVRLGRWGHNAPLSAPSGRVSEVQA